MIPLIAYKATVSYPAGKSTYNFPFFYMKKEFVKAKYIKVDGTAIPLAYNKDYQIMGQTLTLVGGTPAGAATLIIYRETPTDQQVRFVDASILKAYDLNIQGIQLLHIAEENTDTIRTTSLMYDDDLGAWNAFDRRLMRLADPVHPQDAVTLHYLTAVDEARVKTMKEIEASTINAKDIAVDAKDEAVQSALNAKKHEERVALAKRDAEAAAIKAKNEAVTSEEERHKAARFAQIAREWADFPGAPAGEGGAKSSKTWAEEAKESAHQAASQAISAENFAQQSKNHLHSVITLKDQAALSAENAATSAEKASKAAESAEVAKAAAYTYRNEANGFKSEAAGACTDAEAARDEAMGAQIVATLSEASAKRDAEAARIAEQNARNYAENARNEATSAKAQANSVTTLMNYLQEVRLYNPTAAYVPGMCAMLPNGDVYRCIKTCHGIEPGTDGETYWIKINTKQASVFENEVVYKYIPRHNLSQPVPYQYFTAPKKGYYQFIIIGGGGHGSRGYLKNGVVFGGNGGGGGCLTQRTLLLQQGERLQFLVGGGCLEDTGEKDNSLGGEMTICTIEKTAITYYSMGGVNGSKTVVGYGSILNPFAPPNAPFPHSDYSGMNGSAGQCVPQGLRALGGTGGASLFAAYGAGGRGGNVKSDGQLENGQKGMDGCAIVRY